MRHLQHYPTYDEPPLVWEHASLQDIFVRNNTDTIRFTIESMQKYPEYHSTFIVAKAFLEELIEDYNDLLNKANETIDLIDNGD